MDDNSLKTNLVNLVVETLFALFNVILWCALIVARPSRFTCPENWHDDGITIRGEFTCTRVPVGPMDWDGTYYDGAQREERSVVPPGTIRGHIYCTSGSMPVVLNNRTVGCQRGARWQED